MTGFKTSGCLLLALAAGAFVSTAPAGAAADDLRVPPGMMLCHSLEAAASRSHAGCWLAHGGQRVEVIAPLPTYAQLRIWSTDGSETTIVYAMRADTDRMLAHAR